VQIYFFAKNIDQALVSLGALPAEHRHLFVGQLVHVALAGGHNALVLTERLLTAVRKQSVISPQKF
jgi:hypothetical protein